MVELTPRVAELYAQTLPRGVPFFESRNLTQRPPGSRWATPEETIAPSWQWRRGGVLLGTYNGKLIGTNDNRHLTLISGNRGGKTSTVLLPNLYSYPGSIIVIDPKGELAAKSAAHRKDVLGQDVYVLDPFGITGKPAIDAFGATGLRPDLRAQFNPLLELDPLSNNVVDDAALVAEAVIPDMTGEAAYWSMAAKNLVQGLILYTLLDPNPAGRTMQAMRSCLYEFDEPDGDSNVELVRTNFFRRMRECGGVFDGFVKDVGGSMLSKAEKESASIFSTATENLSFLASPAMRENMLQSSFKLRDIVHRPMTIYLCLDGGRMATHFRWLRLFIDLALIQIERQRQQFPFDENNKWRVLFMMEEFPVLQHMKRLEMAAGLLSGMGVKLWIVLQDLTQLQSLYKTRWQTFLGNSGAVQAFSLNDMASLEYASNRMGTTSFWAQSHSNPSYDQRVAGHSPETSSITTTPLITPAELAELVERESFRQVVMMAGQPPMVMHRLRHDTVEKIRRGELHPTQ